MLEQFLNHIARHKLCTLSDSILLAVSGGIDSMAMLHLFKESGYRIGVAHCNFQLRGDESNKDELLVVEECKRLAIPFILRSSIRKHSHGNRVCPYKWLPVTCVMFGSRIS